MRTVLFMNRFILYTIRRVFTQLPSCHKYGVCEVRCIFRFNMLLVILLRPMSVIVMTLRFTYSYVHFLTARLITFALATRCI